MSSLLGLAQVAARRWGLNVTRAANTLERKRAEVLRRYQISVVLDVGANVGQYAQELRHNGYTGRIISFEPLSTAFTELVRNAGDQVSLHECRQLALGDTDTDTRIHVSKVNPSSSILEATDSFTTAAPSALAVASEEIRLAKLDTIRAGMVQETDRVYLKIDTQGYEDRVIRGASDTLRQVYGVEVELSLVELYRGQALLPQVWDLLMQAGFTPVWIERGFIDPLSGFMLQCDCLFVRNDS